MLSTILVTAALVLTNSNAPVPVSVFAPAPAPAPVDSAVASGIQWQYETGG